MAKSMGRWIVLAALWCAAAAWAGAADYIWVEGEAAQAKRVTQHNWYESVKKDQLSGGAFLANYGPQPGEATYNFDVQEAKEYTLWVRANPVANPQLSYKIDAGAYQLIDLSMNTGNTNIAADDKPDMRFVAWAKGRAANLTAGAHTITFQMAGGNNNHGMLDCFILTAVPFTPIGMQKPGEKLNRFAPGTWSFEPDPDKYTPDAVFDWRTLNEKVAGESGYVKRTPDGDFTLGNGQPVRFWAVNTGVESQPGTEALEAHARHLAKRGVNMARWFGALDPKGPNAKAADVDAPKIDLCQKFVSTMKKEGIYTLITPYWAMTPKVTPSWGVQGHESGNAAALVFWDPTMQAAYKNWIKELFTRPNPYDPNKTPLAKDPAVAIFQIQNEDSMLFWTMQTVAKSPEKARLDALYADWLKKKGKTTKPQLTVDQFWNADKNPSPDLKDSIQFMTETMHAWNAEVARYLKEDLGCQALVNAGNWRTANETLLLDDERWSYSANEVMAVNRYVTGIHVSPEKKDGYLVAKGDTFTDPSVLLEPRRLAINIKQPVGFPFLVTESTWVPPMSFQSEGPFLVSAYSSLSGVDVYFWFACGEVGYDPTIRKWQCANPSIMGGWPAASYIFRKAYIKKGAPAVHEERALADMWDLKTPIIAEDPSFDPNRDAGSFAAQSSIKTAADPLAFLVGPVEVKYDGDPAKSTVADMTKYIDPARKVIKSNTDELVMDSNVGLCTVNAPKAQGATGFLGKAGEIKLGAVSITAKNAYGTVMVMSLDDKALTESARVFVQITTKCRPFGWKTQSGTFKSADGKTDFQGEQIVDTGASPWNVENTDMTITVRNPGLKSATFLDINGYRVKDKAVKAEAQGGALVVTPPADAMYLVLE